MNNKNTVLGELGEICGKVAFVCGLYLAFSKTSRERKLDLIENCMKESNLFSDKEMDIWQDNGLEGLCYFYNLDDEFEGALMSFAIPEYAVIFQRNN